MHEQPKSHECFMCGVENKQGMRLIWYSDYEDGLVWTNVEIAHYYNGYPGIAHGGIVAALLDETSFRAIELQEKDRFLVDRLFVTAKLDIQYHRPTPTVDKVRVVGWIKNAGQKYYETAAAIRLLDGTVTAQCKALIMQPPHNFKEESGFPSNWALKTP